MYNITSGDTQAALSAMTCASFNFVWEEPTRPLWEERLAAYLDELDVYEREYGPFEDFEPLEAEADFDWNEAPKEPEEAKAKVDPGDAPAILLAPDILAEFDKTILALGIVGEQRVARLTYLTVTSRLAPSHMEMASLLAKAMSSTGKSFVVGRVFEFFTKDEDYIARSSLSPKALAYNKMSLSNKTLFIGEASGICSGDDATMLRQLLSEGEIHHSTIINGKGKTFHVSGPMNCVITTTSFEIDPETETRLLSVKLDESAEQTRAIMLATAQRREVNAQVKVDLSEWRVAQRWLVTKGERRVVIPFAVKLAELVPPAATRLRRDFRAVLNLAAAHAMLHQCTRARDADGYVVATLDDYEAVYKLVHDLVAEGAKVTVKLGKDKGNVSRYVNEAIRDGYLHKIRQDNGKEFIARYAPLPMDGKVLPTREELSRCWRVV